MSGWWLASYVVLWVLVVGMAVVLLVVLRQLGLLYLRTRSGGVHLDEGPAVGAPITTFHAIDDRLGVEVRIPDPAVEMTMIVFASPHCPICKEVVRGVRPATRGLGVAAVVISEGTDDENDELRQAVDAEAAFVVSVARQRQLGIETIPYALVASREGMVLAKHVVNGLDDLEDVLDKARRSGRALPVFSSMPEEARNGSDGQ